MPSARSERLILRLFVFLLPFVLLHGLAFAQPQDHNHPETPATPATTPAPFVRAVVSRDQYKIQATRSGQAPEIDGLLTDEAWKSAAVIDSFTQQEPANGQPATERTEVRVTYDAGHLYIAMRAFDSDPSSMVASEMRREIGRAHV